MSTALIEQNQMNQIMAIEQTAKDTQAALRSAEETGSAMLKAIVLSKGMAALRQQLTEEILRDVMSLQGSKLGFRTDKDSSGGYKVEVIRDVLIEATIRGFRMVGNEVNIIAGGFYPTVEGYQRLVREQVDDLEIALEVPELGSGVAYVPAFARFVLEGRTFEIDRTNRDGRDLRIMVKVNNGMGHDAILGKARSRLYRLIAERISGLQMPDEDGGSDADPTPPATPAISAAVPERFDAWSREWALEIADQIDQATDRAQLERIYKRWTKLARDPRMESQLANACSSKAAELKQEAE